MGTAPRRWQTSLSNLSVTSKVGIVLLLPVVLASIFAVLRINDGLSKISELNAAAEQVKIIRPMLVFGQATEQLGLTAMADQGTGNDAALDKVSAHFDQAAADLDTALRTVRADSQVSTELSAAVSAGRTMRSGLRSSPPNVIGQQMDDVAAHILGAINRSPSAEENTIERTFLQLGTTMTGRRLLMNQYMLAGAIEAAPAMRSQLLVALGGEMVMIAQYQQLEPTNAIGEDKLMAAAQARMAAFGQDKPDQAQGAASLQASLDAYNQIDSHLVDSIDSRLAARTTTAHSSVLRDVAVVIAMLLAGLALALAVARSLVVPVRRLRSGALQVAHVDLPQELEVVRDGGDTPEITPIDVNTTEEVGQLARAVDDIHRVALHLAAEQARLRLQIGNMFETLSRRSQSLVEQQLTLIEELERDEDDSERLQSLFRLDHMATRMRRNGDNLLVLAGTALRRGHLPPVALSDMLWSAVSQVEDYQRVEIGAVPDGIVAGEPAVDIEHLLAELIDNALRYSPPSTPVAVSVARAVDGGYLIEITDRGLGMSSDDLRGINERLASGGEVNIETARRMGLFVVGRLAQRHSITVSMRRTSTMAQQPGITASVHLPGSLVSPVPDNAPTPQPITSAYPAPVAALPAPEQPRVLTAVPNVPEPAPAPAAFGMTTSGLPQRRPAGPVSDIPAPQITRLTPVGETTEPQPVGRFGGGMPSPAADTGYFTPVVDPEGRPAPGWAPPSRAAEPPIDIWAEAEDYPPAPPAPPRAPEPPRMPEPAPIERTTVMAAARTGYPGVQHQQQGGRTAAPATQGGLRPVGREAPTPIYQRMVSEWLVEPSSNSSAEVWSSPADAGWAAAADASNPSAVNHTVGGLPIRQPGAQLVPGGLAPATDNSNPDPDEIRNNLSRHLSGVRSGRANAQNNDGGPA
ncbi:ATP-binding protein [Nocardia sp. BMG111209]|uniref:sensor histidine kinase n=1 Tax=Nocardia sp. BMG111209 TaxID=1160137 RepID=UPI00037AC920|nr:ATP-binding protein [Nocardia sp. BMG111209]